MKAIRSTPLALVILVAALALPVAALASSRIMLGRSVISFTGRMTMNGNVICTNTFTITLFLNPIHKTPGIDQGTITGSLGGCTGGGSTGAGTILAGTRVRYESFSGQRHRGESPG